MPSPADFLAASPYARPIKKARDLPFDLRRWANEHKVPYDTAVRLVNGQREPSLIVIDLFREQSLGAVGIEDWVALLQSTGRLSKRLTAKRPLTNGEGTGRGRTGKKVSAVEAKGGLDRKQRGAGKPAHREGKKRGDGQADRG